MYANNLSDVQPDGVVLHNEIKFVQKDKTMGNKYSQGVIVALEQGFSYGGTAGDALN